MSHHGYQPSFRNTLPSDGTMELYIETLTGTAFEMTVSPFDQIISIKSKIQRVEGIPVSHQHLLYNMHELDDSACLIDYSIQDGATLKLVLSMRGGPISTRRLPLGEELAWKEQLRDLVEGSRDEANERLPPGARVTVFVFGEGNQLNLVRVIENDDGSYTPLSESWSGSSIRNLFAEEDPEVTTKRLQENSVTMGKVQELQHKMESLSIQKKPKNFSPETALPGNGNAVSLLSMRETERLQNPGLDLTNTSTRSQRNFLHLPPLSTNEPSSSPCLGSFRTTSNLLQPSRSKEYRLSRRESKLEPSGRRPSRGGLLLDTKQKQHNENITKNPRERRRVTDQAAAPSLTISEEESDLFANEATNITISQIPHNQVMTKVGTSGRYRLSRFVLEDSEDRPKTSPDNLTKQQKAAQEICDLLTETKWHRHTRQSRVPCSNSQLELPAETQLDFGRGDFVHKERTVEDSGLKMSVRSPRYGRRSLLLPSVRPECKQTHETYRPTMMNDDERQPSRNASQELSTPATEPDPDEPDAPEEPGTSVPRKANTVRTRCAQCKKRLNITNIYTCRCNQIFCSTHRHCETHSCTFDYKTHGRKLIEAANPVVSAPKLPKI